MATTKSRLGEKLKLFEEICKRHGLRLTHQRIEILREFADDSSHPSAEEIYKRISQHLPTISLDTVYRTITTFEELGIIKRVHILDDHSRFDPNTEVHHHLVCKRCKKVEDFYWPDFDRLEIPINLKTWGIQTSKHVEIRGLCQDCKQLNK